MKNPIKCQTCELFDVYRLSVKKLSTNKSWTWQVNKLIKSYKKKYNLFSEIEELLCANVYVIIIDRLLIVL